MNDKSTETPVKALGAKSEAKPAESEARPVEIVPPGKEVESALKKLAETKPNLVTEVTAMMASMPMVNPLAQKMTEGHITQMLDLAAKHDEREYDLQCKSHSGTYSIRRYAFAAFVIVILLIGAILVLFRDKPEILVPVLSGIIGLVAGSIGGYGFGRRESK
jgi:hypothetical protein